MPQFAHLPLLLKPDGNGKLSKRDGDRLGFPVFPLNWTDPVTGEVSSGYREKATTPKRSSTCSRSSAGTRAVNRNCFHFDELVEAFSLERVSKAGAKFDPEKTKWFNEQYLRKQDDTEIAQRLRLSVHEAYTLDANDPRWSDDYLLQAVALLKDRVQFESELLPTGRYLFEAPVKYDEAVIAKRWKPERTAFFLALCEAFAVLEPFNAETAEQSFQSVAAAQGLKPGEVLQLFRVILSGQGGGVNLFGMVALLGRQQCIDRIQAALVKLQQTA